MSDRVSGHSGRSRLAARAALLIVTLGLVAGPVAPLAAAADALTVTTPFPSLVAEPGSTATFALTVSVPSDGNVDLKAEGVPTGWQARFAGGGNTIDAAYVTAAKPVEVNATVEIPPDAQPGSTTIRVRASGPGGTATLPLSVRVADSAAGDIKLTSDFPELKGPSSSTFTFTLTLSNGTSAEETFGIDAQGPDGWTVSAKPAGQAQATSLTVAANGTGSITVSAQPPTTVAAGSYPIRVAVTGGGKSAQADLQVTITGTYTLDVSTPNQVLSTSATAGNTTDLAITLTNNGTAPITAVTPTATAPTGWKVTFDPASIDTIPPANDTIPGGDQPASVTAHITPSSDAITGDYNVTISAKGAEASGDVTIRVKVETPTFWWIAGIGLIAVVFVGLWWVFRRYGRR